MSVLGKRKRNQTQLDCKENDDHHHSPPKKKIRSSNNNHNNNNNNNNDTKLIENEQIASFSMEAVINQEFKTITDKNLEGIIISDVFSN